MDGVLLDEPERKARKALAELKEKISLFLYSHYIDFDRDVGIKIKEEVFHPSFILRKSHIVIDCFRLTEEQDDEYAKRSRLYKEDGVKYIALDLRNLAMKNVDQALREQLPKLGCAV
ncbi:hypothetical protein JW826_04275 [Candidatus Woesearchaeota archaeon]|nr:hypothetical protein [Candidatus Woesearchaeota archaeon]